MNTSRRNFAKVLGSGAVYAALAPSLFNSRLAPSHALPAATNIVRLSSNENPYGPSPLAIKAMTDAFNLAWRYPDEHEQFLIESLAKLHRIETGQILLGNGSGEILKVAAAAFTSPERKLVVPNPTFEAILNHARTAKAEVVQVNLTANYEHDLPRMLAINDAGLIYICNPNNPTASITPKEKLRAFLNNVPKQTMVLVDEAYHHYVDSNDYESLMPLLSQHPNLIIARTFSKVYAMAGLRCGYCVAQPDLIKQMRSQQTWDSVNIMALVAAKASLDDVDQVEQGKKRNGEVKRFVYAELDKLKLQYVPSHANFLMVDLKRDVRPVIGALRDRSVQVGRVFPSMPNFMRVTIGTRPQMDAFFSAFRSVMG